jgi:hypothetical protein
MIFLSVEEARDAYIEKATEIYGEFVNISIYYRIVFYISFFNNSYIYL